MFLPSRKQLNRGKTKFTNIPVCSCQGTSEKPKLGLPGFGVGSPACLELKRRRVTLRSRVPLFPSGPFSFGSLCPKEASLRWGDGQLSPRFPRIRVPLGHLIHPATCYPPGLDFPETKLRKEPLPRLRNWGFGTVMGARGRGDGVVGSPRDDRVLQVSTWVWAPLFTRSAALNPLPFPPREEEMVKDYTVAAGTSKGGSGSQR